MIYRTIELYKRLYRSVTGESAYVGGAQYAIMKNLLKKQDEMEVTLRLRRYFSCDYWFTDTNNYSLKNFIGHYNEITELETLDGNQSKPIEDITSDEDLRAAEEAMFNMWVVLKTTPIFLDFLRTMFAIEVYQEDRYDGDDVKFDSICEEEAKRESPWIEDYDLLQMIADGFSDLAGDCHHRIYLPVIRELVKVGKIEDDLEDDVSEDDSQSNLIF